MPEDTNTTLSKYNVGDMIVIPYVEKNGIIISVEKYRYTYNCTIFWQYKSGETETSTVDEHTIDMWISLKEGKAKDNQNRYYPVIK
jgi:hypothetical protein